MHHSITGEQSVVPAHHEVPLSLQGTRILIPAAPPRMSLGDAARWRKPAHEDESRVDPFHMRSLKESDPQTEGRTGAPGAGEADGGESSLGVTLGKWKSSGTHGVMAAQPHEWAWCPRTAHLLVTAVNSALCLFYHSKENITEGKRWLN